MTVAAAALAIQSVIMTAPGLLQASPGPEDLIGIYPAAVVYSSKGRFLKGSAHGGRLDANNPTWGGLHTITCEIHLAKLDTKIHYPRMLAFIDDVTRVLMVQAADDLFGDTIMELEEVRYDVGAMKYGSDETFGLRFQIDVQIQEDGAHD